MSATETRASVRADIYGLLGELLSFPSEQLEEAASAGHVRVALAHLFEHLEFGALQAPELGCGAVTGELASEYIRLFDAPAGPATPLYTGVYARRRRDAMEELLRFYRHFGLRLASDAHDLPDFVPTVLEFMRFLAVLSDGSDPDGAAERARMDILERHLRPWASETISRLLKRSPHPFYRDAVATLAAMTAAELNWLRGQTGMSRG